MKMRAQVMYLPKNVGMREAMNDLFSLENVVREYKVDDKEIKYEENMIKSHWVSQPIIPMMDDIWENCDSEAWVLIPHKDIYIAVVDKPEYSKDWDDKEWSNSKFAKRPSSTNKDVNVVDYKKMSRSYDGIYISPNYFKWDNIRANKKSFSFLMDIPFIKKTGAIIWLNTDWFDLYTKKSDLEDKDIDDLVKNEWVYHK